MRLATSTESLVCMQLVHLKVRKRKMSKLFYILIAFFSMILAGVVSFFIGLYDGGYFAFIPLIAWFILVQIFIVPRVLKKK